MTGNEYPRWTTGWSEDRYGFALPESIEYPLYNLAGYGTNGYQGLSECLDLPFEWCYGCGHSSVMMRRIGSFLGDPNFFWERCYPVRLESETGYSATQKWHTVYPWLASDLTYVGALIFVGLLGFLLARVWEDCLRGNSTLAVCLLAQLLMIFYYIPANNAHLSYLEESLAFWELLIAWWFFRPRARVAQRPARRLAHGL